MDVVRLTSLASVLFVALGWGCLTQQIRRRPEGIREGIQHHPASSMFFLQDPLGGPDSYSSSLALSPGLSFSAVSFLNTPAGAVVQLFLPLVPPVIEASSIAVRLGKLFVAADPSNVQLTAVHLAGNFPIFGGFHQPSKSWIDEDHSPPDDVQTPRRVPLRLDMHPTCTLQLYQRSRGW